ADPSGAGRGVVPAPPRARRARPGGSGGPPRAGSAARAAPLDPDTARALGIDDDSPTAASPPQETGAVSGVAATSQALERLLREGRPEFTERPWTPHRPPRPEKSEGGQRLVIRSDFAAKGDQPQAIAELVEGVTRGDRTQVLLGVTGSGKTFTMAKVIEATQRPALVLAPNKTLAAQLYGEFRGFFPDNAVEYF